MVQGKISFCDRDKSVSRAVSECNDEGTLPTPSPQRRIEMSRKWAKFAVFALALACVPAMHAQDSSTTDASQAQPPAARSRRPPNPDMQLRRLTKELNLTTEQQPQVRQILEARDSQIQQIHGNTSQTVEQMQTQVRAVMSASNSKLMAVLDEQQKQTFQRMQQQRMSGAGAANQQSPTEQENPQ
jgi:Spy/CpxP family protein refolding chaperone